MVKAAYNSISTRLSTENPRAPPMADFATRTIRPKGRRRRLLVRAFLGRTQNWLYCKFLFCNSETENGLREGTIMNYSPYLGGIRGEHVFEPRGRSARADRGTYAGSSSLQSHSCGPSSLSSRIEKELAATHLFRINQMTERVKKKRRARSRLLVSQRDAEWYNCITTDAKHTL